MPGYAQLKAQPCRPVKGWELWEAIDGMLQAVLGLTGGTAQSHCYVWHKVWALLPLISWYTFLGSDRRSSLWLVRV